MRLVTACVLAVAAFVATPCAAESAQQSFDRIAALAGHWQGTFANGRAHSVDIRTSAGGTVIVETWTLGPERESITIYHLDGERLLATHYCPQGNAPRLQRVATGDDATPARIAFEFVDGANLQPPDGWHQHSFWLEPRADGTFVRAETYVQNGTRGSDEPEEPVTYSRVDAD